MNSEENTIKLIAMLDKTVDEIEKLDKRLQFYQDKMTVSWTRHTENDSSNRPITLCYFMYFIVISCFSSR